MAGQPAPALVWPLPAASAVVADLRRKEQQVRQEKLAAMEDQQAYAQWERTARHQADADKILNAAAPAESPGPNYDSRPLNEVLRNPTTTGANHLTLAQLLALHPVPNGGEPETVIFEAPIAYNILTNLGQLCLVLDTNNDDSDEGSLVQQMELKRADNGDCLLAWNTIFESPGTHALQMGLEVNQWPTNFFTGPVEPVVITNFCQFSLASAHFNPEAGATLHAKLPETNARYVIELNATDGTRIKTITNRTANGIIKEHWDLLDDHGQRFTGEFFNTVFHITLTDSGRTQTMRGP